MPATGRAEDKPRPRASVQATPNVTFSASTRKKVESTERSPPTTATRRKTCSAANSKLKQAGSHRSGEKAVRGVMAVLYVKRKYVRRNRRDAEDARFAEGI